MTIILKVPVKETSASLSMPSSWMLSLSDLELPLDLFMFRKYWPHLCRPASFFSRFSLARLFWNQTWKGRSNEMHQSPCNSNSEFICSSFSESPPPPNSSKGFTSRRKHQNMIKFQGLFRGGHLLKSERTTLTRNGRVPRSWFITRLIHFRTATSCRHPREQKGQSSTNLIS